MPMRRGTPKCSKCRVYYTYSRDGICENCRRAEGGNAGAFCNEDFDLDEDQTSNVWVEEFVNAIEGKCGPVRW